MKLQRYDYMIYTHGQQLLMADALSRATGQTKHPVSSSETEVSVHVDLLSQIPAKWHLLGFFGLSLYWHPQKVLQRTLLEGSLERTLLRTLTSDEQLTKIAAETSLYPMLNKVIRCLDNEWPKNSCKQYYIPIPRRTICCQWYLTEGKQNCSPF